MQHPHNDLEPNNVLLARGVASQDPDSWLLVGDTRMEPLDPTECEMSEVVPFHPEVEETVEQVVASGTLGHWSDTTFPHMLGYNNWVGHINAPPLAVPCTMSGCTTPTCRRVRELKMTQQQEAARMFVDDPWV